MIISSNRVWSIRAAVLKWLYLKAMLDRDRDPTLNAAEIAKAVDCQGEPITGDEVESACDWLLVHGHIRSGSRSNGVPRVSMTAKGEAHAASNKSVRDRD